MSIATNNQANESAPALDLSNLRSVIENAPLRIMLVDRDLALWLRGHPAYRVRPLRRVSVRGYDHLQPWLVRRRPTGDDPSAPDVYDEDAFDDEEQDDEKPV